MKPLQKKGSKFASPQVQKEDRDDRPTRGNETTTRVATFRVKKAGRFSGANTFCNSGHIIYCNYFIITGVLVPSM